MASEISAENLPENEELGRRVFSSSDAKRGRKKNTINLRVFMETQGCRLISVDRMIRSDREIACFGHAGAEERSKNEGKKRTFYGWAVLTVADAENAAENKQRKVCASPKCDNPFHADIWLPKDCLDDWDLQKEHATELASASVWKAAPKNSA